MNRDDVIRMAVQCQLVTTANREGIFMDALDQFAKLVAAKEREACAKLCVKLTDDWLENHHPINYAKAIRARGES